MTASSHPFPVCRLTRFLLPSVGGKRLEAKLEVITRYPPPSGPSSCHRSRRPAELHRQSFKSYYMLPGTATGLLDFFVPGQRIFSSLTAQINVAADYRQPSPPFLIKMRHSSIIQRPERSDLGPTLHSHDATHGTLLFMFQMLTRSKQVC